MSHSRLHMIPALNWGSYRLGIEIKAQEDSRVKGRAGHRGWRVQELTHAILLKPG